MIEQDWVKSFAPIIEKRLRDKISNISVLVGEHLPYASEIRSYKGTQAIQDDYMKYETDLLITESDKTEGWIPRVIVEAKCHGSINTHDAITYSHKAATHRNVHPYLRYGILLGEREKWPLPGRLFRHGTQFDFMLSWVGTEPTKMELDDCINVLLLEINASKTVEEMIFDSRKRNRKHYTVLHKQLIVK